MRRRLTLAAAAAVVLVVAAVVIAANSGGDSAPSANTTGLDAQTMSAGEIDIQIEPRQLDDRGAVIAIALDTHSVELTSDLAADARLEVDGTPWPVVAWQGDGPGGHHREGTLQFEAAGAAAGDARLTIAGFDEPVEATWELGT